MTENNNMGCTRKHWYTVEVAGQPDRYAGSDTASAVDALCGIDLDSDDEGYVVASHVGDLSYCSRHSNEVENAAILASLADHGTYATR